MAISNNLVNMIYEQQQASMQRMLEAWDNEIEAQAAAFKEIASKQADAQALQDQLTSGLEVYLAGQVAQAQGGSDVSISIPSGVQIAGALASAPSGAEIESLADHVEGVEADVAKAQNSAAWALQHAFMPHPEDLSKLMKAGGVDAPFAERLSAMSNLLKALDGAATKHPQMAMAVAQERVHTLKDQVGVMKAYGPKRTLDLIKNPMTLKTSLARAVPPVPQAGGPKMGHAALGKVLDNLFKRSN
jgi:hypothetical protein